MEKRDIIMTFSVPPSADDLLSLAETTLDSLPEELLELVETLGFAVEELPDEAVMEECDLEDPYELVALYRSGKQIAPGIQSKVANDDDLMILFRRPLLDLWCETQEELSTLLRQVMIEELGQNFDFSEDEIDEMTRRHHQIML